MRLLPTAVLVLLILTSLSSCTVMEGTDLLTAEERHWIKEHPDPIKVGVGLHYPPYETFNMSGDYRGLSADFIRLISEKTGLEFEPVRFRNRQETLKALLSGKVSVMAALEMTPELRETLDFTQPYVSVPAAIICRKEFTEDLTLEKLSGMRIGVTVSDHFLKYLHERYPDGGFTIVPMAGGYIGGLRCLAVGDVDALICDMALASRYIANARISNLRIAGITNYSIDLRIASRNDDTMLGNILRKGLSMVLPHERQIVEEEWLSLQYRPFWVSRTFWIGVFVVFGAIIGSIVLILFWNRSLKRQVNQRTRALRSINKVLLGSLDCRTEQEVMLRCLTEAKTMSGSEQAFLAQVSQNRDLLVLLTVTDNNSSRTASISETPMRLNAEQIQELKSGRHVCAHMENSDRRLIAVPLQQEEDALPKIICVMRPRKEYTDGEISQITEVLFVFEEALQRKRTEISLHEKERQLQRVQRMEALGTLAGGIAHDFNNLLGVIVANGEMIELFHLDANQSLESKTRAILAAAYRGRDLVSQILTFTNNGKEETRLMNISPIIKETAKFLKASLPASIEIEYAIGQPEPPVLADPTQVHQVLMNLCTNAAHAMSQNGGTLSIDLHQAKAMLNFEPAEKKADSYLCLTVSDTGKGIPHELLERIFDPFFTTKTMGQGTGLGLSMVQGIVKAWDGVVQVESMEGKGSVFRIYIPAQREKASEPPIEVPLRQLPDGTGTILFVDDEKELVESYGELLTTLGYKVHTITDGKQALELFQSAPDEFDLVITDYSLSGLRGDKLAKRILNIRSDIPIILCTGYSQSFSENDAQEMGIEAFLHKPVELRNLALCVNRFLRPGDGFFSSNET